MDMWSTKQVKLERSENEIECTQVILLGIIKQKCIGIGHYDSDNFMFLIDHVPSTGFDS